MTIFILGPCGIDDRDTYIKTGKILSKVMQGQEWYFKASFDKANRTSLSGSRAIGLEQAIPIFKEIKELIPNIKLVTDVHEVGQLPSLYPYIDIIQIPAFLSRQTDLVVESAKLFDTVFLKKGQWCSEYEAESIGNKIKETNENTQAWLCERGSSFGNVKLIVDFSIVDKIKNGVWDKFILDCSHTTHKSRDVFGVQGDVNLSKRFFLSSEIMGYDGSFLEIHPNPELSASDKTSQLTPQEFSSIFNKYQNISKAL